MSAVLAPLRAPSAVVAAMLVGVLAGPAAAQDIPRLPTASPDTVAAPVPLDIALEGAPADTLASSPIPEPAAAPPAEPFAEAAPLPRVVLVSTPRPVVLLRRDRRAGVAPATRAIAEATVQVDADGRRTLVYSERPAAAPDVGADMGCGPAADRAIARLGALTEAPLMLFDEGPLVGAAQQLLCVAGYAVPQNGVFGEEMERAVRAFQEDVNADAVEADRLVESGTLDPQTRRVLEARTRIRLGN